MVTDELYQIADELRAVASIGLRYTEHGYDKERYEKVLQASARLVAALDGKAPEEIYAEYTGNLAHISPLVCVEAVVIRDGKILLIQRSDDRMWALPGGLAEVGESPAQAAERELWEEAGVRGKAEKLLGIFDSRRWPSKAKMQLCILVFLISTEDAPGLHTAAQEDISSLHETLDVKFFGEDDLPQFSKGHELRVPMVFKQLRDEAPVPYYD